MRPVLFFLLLLWAVPVHSQVVFNLADSTSAAFAKQLDDIYPDAAYSAYEEKPMELVGMWLENLDHLDKTAADLSINQTSEKQACFLKLYFTPEGRVKQLFFRMDPPFVVSDKDMKRILEVSLKRLSAVPHKTAYRQSGQWMLYKKSL